MSNLIRSAVGAAAVVTAASAGFQIASDVRDRRQFPPPGRMVDVGGRRLHAVITGSGGPTILVQPSLGTPAIEWHAVQDRIGDLTTMCVLDRGGVGWSDPAPWPRGFPELVDETQRFLDAAALPGPVIMVGHSIGGLVARLFAARHPEQVAHLVLVDSSHEDQQQRLAGMGLDGGRGELVKLVLTVSAKYLGIQRARHYLGDNTVVRDALRAQDLDTPANEAMYLSSRTRRADVQELVGFMTSCDSLRREARDLGDLPLTVITGGMEGREGWTDEWRAMQKEMVAMSRRGTQVHATRGGHHINRDDPDTVARVLRELVHEHRGEAFRAAATHQYPGPRTS